jgi:two-component system sensor histidine kinase KdpD
LLSAQPVWDTEAAAALLLQQTSVPRIDDRRPDPEQLLLQVQAEEAAHRRGRLKIFLGYTSGVGKSFRMLDEGRRRKERGEDVVVASAQSDQEEEITHILERLEVIPELVVNGIRVIDVPRVLRRKPGVCLIDGLAYDNPPTWPHAKRWQDVDQLIEAGISVITSLNLQHVAEKSAQVEAIRGKKSVSTVPEAFIKRADEIIVVDAPPEYCLEHGHDPNRFLNPKLTPEQQLSALREIALLLAADVVDHQLEEYLRTNGIVQNYGAQERVMVCITPRTNADVMIRRGRRQADRFHGDLYVAYVEQAQLSPEDQQSLDQNLAIAREVEAQIEILSGEEPIATLLDFARVKGVTQIFVGHSQRRGWWHRMFGTPLERLIFEAEGIDVRVFPHP